MKSRGRLLLAVSIIGILFSVVLPSVNAEIFDIGERVESDAYYTPFTSGVYALEFPRNTTDIFDGNLSTGIDYENISLSGMYFTLHFPYPIYVNNITLKTSFAGNKSLYNIALLLNDGIVYEALNQNDDTFISLNCTINQLILTINDNGTDHFYFNDVIIDYTPSSANQSSINQAISYLTNTVNSLQNQINNLNQQIADMNNTINSLNQSQLQILENLTTLHSNYNQINNSLMSLFNEIENLNITTTENITLLKDDLTLIESNINDIYQSLNDLTTNVTELSEIQNLIDQTTQDILYLNENITEIKNTIPSEYDDTALTTRVFQLESENAALSDQIQNLTDEMYNLKEDQDEPGNFVALGAFVFGILGILIAIVAVILATKKSESERSNKEKDESEGDEDKASEEDSDP
jgi:predicted nuclease with TOPRIM domain